MKKISINYKLFLFIFITPFILFLGMNFIGYLFFPIIIIFNILIPIIQFIIPFSDELYRCGDPFGCAPYYKHYFSGYSLLILFHLLFSLIITKVLGVFVKFNKRIHKKIPVKHQSTFSWNNIFKFIIFITSLIIALFSAFFLFSHNTNVKVLDYDKAYVDCGDKKLFIKDYLSDDVAFNSYTRNTKEYFKYICSSFYDDIGFEEFIRNFSDNYTFEEKSRRTGTIKCKYNSREYNINYYPYGSEKYYKGLYDCSDMKSEVSYNELVSIYKLQPKYNNIQKFNMDWNWIILATFLGILIVVVINTISYLAFRNKDK